MMKQRLKENWKMRRTDWIQWQPAIVPGSVYTDMYRNGDMEDPFFKDNELKAKQLMDYDYEYITNFDCDSELLACDRVILHFDGLDTVADIYVNGSFVGDAINMHRVWEYDIKDAVKEKDNELRVVLHSPNKYVAEAFKKCRTMGNEDTLEGFMHLRKAHCMFGWDWGACLPDAGIFRPVSILGVDKARIDNVLILQEHVYEKEADDFMPYTSVEKDDLVPDRFADPVPVVKEVKLSLHVEEEIAGKYACNRKKEPELIDITGGFSEEGNVSCYKVEITAPDGTVSVYENSPVEIIIEEPCLWWPKGYGSQPLYTVKVVLYKDGREVDTWEKRIGLRTLTMRRQKDEWGECFAQEVNGICVFAMGADYIPEDHLIGRVTPETTRALLEKAEFANFNSIRVWGGGYYPDDWFFDICDEMGFMVWQDFMFACSVYELTPEFEANITQEFIDNVKRLRSHPSLALLCGNNEMEMFVESKNPWVTKYSEVRDYYFMYERIIPGIVKEYAPQCFYWPASPSSGGSMDAPNDPDRGDVHYWDVWHGNKPFPEYRKFFFRYASEFGFQAFPAMKTIEQISDDPADHNPFSYIMEKHQRQNSANGKIMGYMQQTYKYPNSFPIFVYASQLLQADAIRYGVEHYRRNRGRCMGAVYWQFNDCWPVVSWASVDYCGRMKALHYYAKRFFAPIMLSCEEQGMLTTEKQLNRQHFEFEKSIRLNVANETMEEAEVTVKWALRNAAADILKEGEENLKVPALTSVWLEKKEFPEADLYNEYISYELWKDGEMISDGSVLFSLPKYFRYQDPELSYRIEGQEIIVSAAAYAKSVEVQNENEDLVLSDNYFDLHAGERRLKILSGSTENLRLRSVWDIK